MTTVTRDYDVRAYRDEDQPAVLALLGATLAGGPTGRRTAEFFRWKHERNPFGRSLALVAEAEGQLLGVRLFLRWHFVTAGQPVPAVRAVDTATHPDHQGQGIFRRLTLDALARARSEAALIFNTPNGQSLPGYLKMGWTPVGRVPIAVRPVRPLRFLRGARQAEHGAPSAAPPPCSLPSARAVLAEESRVAGLLEERRRDGTRLETERSVAFLRWRYADAPDLDYRAITIEAGNELAGLALGRLRRRGPLTEFTLAEVIVRDGDLATARRLLTAAARTGCDHVATHVPIGSEAAAVARRRRYLVLPHQGMTFVAKPLTPVHPNPAALASWRLWLGDLEVF